MVRVTHVGGPTLLELDGWRILTDPTFDPPGRRYWFGWGTSSSKSAEPTLGPGELGSVDVVPLSHDHHADDLDDRGRACLVTAGETTVILHLGSVKFPLTGPLRYSMDGHDATALLELLRPRVAIPVQYEGWSHFSETRADLQTALDRGGHVVTWLTPGPRRTSEPGSRLTSVV